MPEIQKAHCADEFTRNVKQCYAQNLAQTRQNKTVAWPRFPALFFGPAEIARISVQFP